MERLEYTDIYKLNPGDNVLFVTGKWVDDKIGGYYVPDIDIMQKQVELLSPKLEERGINAMFCLNIFADIKSFDKDTLVKMRDILNEEIEKMEGGK